MTDELTRDSIFRGDVTVIQPSRGCGYRFSVDSVLLGHFASSRRARRAVDLGAGSGVVGFILLHAGAAARVLFVERDELLLRACREGIAANGYGDRAEVVPADMRKKAWVSRIGAADLAVCNPPYRRSGSGWISPRGAVASARHEVTLDLGRVLGRSSEILRAGGRLCLVIPPERLEELMGEGSAAGFRVLIMRFVHTKPSRPAKTVLVELRLRAGRAASPVIQPPLVIMYEDGAYTPEMQGILEGRR
jgi:tRNA1Val (adenine37-N6)-methyltransferase